VYSGTATGTSVRIAELFRYAMASGGVGIVLVHNHPSGDPEPSLEDLKLTREVLKAANIMDIEFLDHLVVADGGYTSIRSQNPSIWTDEVEQPDIMERIQAL
jgi:DNA repair protein RadC